MAVVTAFDAESRYVSSSSAMVEFQPLLPDGPSPYKVYIPFNPAISRCAVQFKQMFGGVIAHELP